jgi:hypothetical protein
MDGRRTVTLHRATGSTDSDVAASAMVAQARLDLAGDLSTHTLMAGVRAADATEAIEATTTITSRCPDSASQNGTDRRARQVQMAIQVNIPALPLPASPGAMNGTATVPMQFDVGGSQIMLDAEVEWTLRPIR